MPDNPHLDRLDLALLVQGKMAQIGQFWHPMGLIPDLSDRGAVEEWLDD